jgi:hypothetical protein
MDQHREKLFGVQPIQGADHQPHIIEFATATDQNSHLPGPREFLNISIKARARNARLRDLISTKFCRDSVATP